VSANQPGELPRGLDDHADLLHPLRDPSGDEPPAALPDLSGRRREGGAVRPRLLGLLCGDHTKPQPTVGCRRAQKEDVSRLRRLRETATGRISGRASAQSPMSPVWCSAPGEGAGRKKGPLLAVEGEARPLEGRLPHRLERLCPDHGPLGRPSHLNGRQARARLRAPLGNPDYPFALIVEDALESLSHPAWLAKFDVIHASPPCQARTTMSNRWRGKGGAADSARQPDPRGA
jgi:hypothetical protein